MRSFEEWDAHPHGQLVPTVPVARLTRIGDAPPKRMPASERPLSGVRVLDLSRVLAGPICGRTLAAHGADVLAISSPAIPNIPSLTADTGRGKLTAFLNLRDAADRATLRGLVREADVFLQGYRPGAIAGLGFSPLDTARMRPGIVHVSLSAYGPVGPWSGRRGFDSLVQTASGFNHAEAEAAGQASPKVLPCQAIDHASGYLLAFGALAALHRRATEGGSWHVEVSLARTGRWIRDLGRVPDGLRCVAPSADGLMEERDTGFGRQRAVRHAARLAVTPARWDRPAMPLGSHKPVWP
jgi:hypothetical protein